MKMKTKVLVAAVSLAAAVQANAAINPDNELFTGSGTGAGELFLSVIDRGGSAPESYSLDLGITASAFRANPNSFLGTSLAADSNLNLLLTHNDGGTIHWNIAAASNPDPGNGTDFLNFGYLTTSLTNLTAANTPQGFTGMAAAQSKLGTYVQAVNTAAGNTNFALNNSTLVNGGDAAFYDGPNWGNNWDGASHGSEAASAQTMNMYFVGLDPADPDGNTTRVDTFSGLWTLASNGTLTFASAAAPVPLPPAVWLLGSALVGLVGVGRRRNSEGMAA